MREVWKGVASVGAKFGKLFASLRGFGFAGHHLACRCFATIGSVSKLATEVGVQRIKKTDPSTSFSFCEKVLCEPVVALETLDLLP